VSDGSRVSTRGQRPVRLQLAHPRTSSARSAPHSGAAPLHARVLQLQQRQARQPTPLHRQSPPSRFEDKSRNPSALSAPKEGELPRDTVLRQVQVLQALQGGQAGRYSPIEVVLTQLSGQSGA